MLHTSKDAETLTRTILALKFFITGDIATPARAEIVLAVQPRGQGVALSPGTSSVLDQVVPVQEILRFPVVATHNATGDYVQVDTKDLDTRSQRKMKEGDEIALSMICSVANAIQIFGTINQWFKQ